MKEKIYLNLGNTELIAVVVRNGLYNGSWRKMLHAIQGNTLILPGINDKTISTLQSFEKKYRLNLNGILFTGIKQSTISRSQNNTIQRVCYAACRGLFSYPCVAGENRTGPILPGNNIHRTYLARPMFNLPMHFNSPFYQGVNRMKPISSKPFDSSDSQHDRLIDQLNKIRECNPCDDQPNCMDHKFVSEATETVIKEYHLEQSFIGKILARSLCWMTAEESRLMRLIEKEGLMIEQQSVFPPDPDDEVQEEFFPQSDVEGYFSENPEPANLPTEPHPLLDVIHDLRESIRYTVRLLSQIKTNGVQGN